MTSSRSLAGTTITLLRTPLLLTDQLAQRLGVEAKVRPVVQQGLSALDALAEKLDGGAPPSASKPASEPAAKPASEPVSKPASEPASKPASEPAPAAKAAPEPDPAPEPAAAPEADDEEVVEHLTDELLEEEEYAQMAGELADDDELRRVQAELNAKRMVAEQHEEHPRPE